MDFCLCVLGESVFCRAAVNLNLGIHRHLLMDSPVAEKVWCDPQGRHILTSGGLSPWPAPTR